MLRRNFRSTVISAFVVGLLASGSAGALILGGLNGNTGGDNVGGGSTGGGGTTNYTVTWDTFTTGLTTGKWWTPGYGTYWANNALVEGYPNSLYVASPGANSLSGYPAFTQTIGQESTNGGLPGMFDHLKWVKFMNNNATSGYKGFDTAPGWKLSCATQITGQTFGTRYHPFGNYSSNNGDDIRLATFGVNMFDPESNMGFAFLFTNKRVYAWYERVPYARAEYVPGGKNYSVFQYAIPVATRSTTSKHALKLSYDRSAGIVQWFLDGKEVYRVSNIGYRLSSRRHMVIDMGGIEEPITMRQLTCGMGIYTVLDGAHGNGDGLVRLSQLPYYQPSKGAPYALSFYDNASLASNRMWGQGAEFHLAQYSVINAPASVVTADPEYSDPGGPKDTNDADMPPTRGDVMW